MTRFKEKRRIDRAIEHSDEPELRWALAYCEMRLRIAPMKHHEKHWHAVEKKVRDAIESIEQGRAAE